MTTALTMVYHDPAGRMREQIERTLPIILSIFPDVLVQASDTANEKSLLVFQQAAVQVYSARSNSASNGSRIGRLRRQVVAQVLRDTLNSHIIYCDADRVLHWAESYAEEFRLISEAVRQFDFTVLGRTPRAFESHPRTQRDTETIINRLFGQISGLSWNDVTSGARGLSRAAAEVIVAQVEDDALSTDVSWPLYLQQHGARSARSAWSIGYIETEGLEFETADRFGAEIAEAGSLAAWLNRLENDPQEWVFRLDLARIEIEAMLPYAKSTAVARYASS